MNLFHYIKKKITAAAFLLCCAMPSMAQTADAAAPAKTVTSGSNQLAILLVVMAAVLAFVIWGLGQVLVVLTRQLMEKNKNAGKILSAITLIVLLLAAHTAPAQTAATADAVKVLPNYGGLSSSSFNMFLIVIIAEVSAIVFLLIAIRRIYAELMPEKTAATEQSKLRQWWSRMDAKLFTKAVPLAKEADVMLDHDYDGIRELDNALPPWWKYGFYITIVVGFIYLLNFHVLGNGKNPTQEYTAEMNQARIEKELFEANNKDKIDENNVPMADETGLAKAKEIFNTKCWSCHGKLGEGGAGPNLTDDYWIHKGSLNDIYRSVKLGYPDKGMQSWANDYTPKEMSFLASYIKRMRGTNPPGAKAPQGDLYTDQAAPAADSAAAPVKAGDKAAVAEKKDSVTTVIKK